MVFSNKRRQFRLLLQYLSLLSNGFAIGYSLSRYGGCFFFHERKNTLIQRIRRKGSYEPLIESFCSRNLPPEGLFVDVGANIGLISLPLLKSKPMAQTLLFEPSPIAYRLLLKNLAINGLERRALAFDSALSDNRAERVPFAENNYPDRSMDGLLYTQRSKGFNQILVTQETLDSAADKANLSRMDLIKIDCEGAELLVLRGARRAVERFRPIVVIEYSQLNYSKYGLCAMDLWNWAVEAGYFLFTERLDLVDERTLEIRIGAAAEREFILIPEAHRWQGI